MAAPQLERVDGVDEDDDAGDGGVLNPDQSNREC